MMRDARTVAPVWVLAAAGALIVGLVIPSADWIQALQTVMAAVVFATFCIQLATAPKPGLVDRMVRSLGGAIIILAAATAILAGIVFLRP